MKNNYVSFQKCLNIFFLFLFLAIGTPTNILGINLPIRAELTVSESYNDNLLLDPENPLDDYITTITPSLTIGAGTGRGKAALVSALDFKKYADQDQLDDTYGRVGITSHYASSELIALDLNAFYRLASTLDSEIEETGQSLEAGDWVSYRIAPQITCRTNEKSRFTLSPSYEKNEYDDPDYYDFQEYRATAEWGYKTPFNELILLLNTEGCIDKYDLGTATNYGAALGIKYPVTPVWEITMYGGMRRTTLEFDPPLEFTTPSPLPLIIPDTTYYVEKEKMQTGVAYVEMTRTLEKGALSLTYSDGSNFTKQSGMVKQRQIKISGRYDVSEHLRIGLSGQWTSLLPLSDYIYPDKDETTYTIKPSASYRINKNLLAMISYQYSKNQDDENETEAERNIVSIGLTTSFDWNKTLDIK